MTKLEDYRVQKEKSKNRIQQLKQDIDQTDNTVKELEAKYKQHVAAGEDEKADNLFPEIEEARMQLNSYNHKLKTIYELNGETVKKAALEAVAEIHKVQKDFKKRSNEVLEEIDKAKKAYLSACHKARDFNNEFLNIKDEYEEVAEQERLNREEIGNTTWLLLTESNHIIQQNLDIKGVRL